MKGERLGSYSASNRWCAVSPKKSENCGYATLDQCRAEVLGLGGWCRPNPFPGTAFGTSRTWSSGPPSPDAGRVLEMGPAGCNRSLQMWSKNWNGRKNGGRCSVRLL